MSAEAGQGTLREATTRSGGGIVAVYAVGTSALLAVVGDVGLDIVRLHRESRPTVEAIEVLLKRGQSGIGGGRTAGRQGARGAAPRAPTRAPAPLGAPGPRVGP